MFAGAGKDRRCKSSFIILQLFLTFKPGSPQWPSSTYKLPENYMRFVKTLVIIPFMHLFVYRDSAHIKIYGRGEMIWYHYVDWSLDFGSDYGSGQSGLLCVLTA